MNTLHRPQMNVPLLADHQARARQACQQQPTDVRGLIVPWHQPW